ncbi:metallophosphoesterase [Pseudalkalibacillus decolorationis]|uniref:metallophosphoesterase n=1 Tax=Pseudalkalibacillus decolorationis TaxID=163879 RepID=UPI00214984B7|nr:metallophosphoesterase [Pseudalkalibacillus decolorationis]
MKQSKKLTLMITAVTLSLTCFLPNAIAASEKSDSNKKRQPELVFPVISDVHIDNSSATDMDKFKTAMDQLNEAAPKQDAFVVVGDLTDYGYESEYDNFFSIYNEKKQDHAVSMFTMGNHDYWNGLSVQDAQKRFLEKTGMDSIYYHKRVKGYHFIALSPENGTTHGLYTVEQINWLGEKLKQAQTDKPGHPIFVFLHQHIKDTVYGSDDWGTQENVKLLYDTLKKYPQVITFSGHSHYPLEDPRSIHQKDFTSVGTSSVSYIELEKGKLQGIHPPGTRELSQGLVVEVYNNEVIINKHDFHQNKLTSKPWKVKYPANTRKFKYIENRDDKQPKFKQHDKLSIIEKESQLRSLTVQFPQAKDNLNVHSYRIKAKNLKTGEIDADFKAFSDFYLDPIPKTLKFPVEGLKPGTAYEIEVQAIDSFNNTSKKTLKAVGRTKAVELVSAAVNPSLVQHGETTSVNVKMKNYGTNKTEGKINLDTPNGWELEKNEITYELNGNQEKTLSVKATPNKELSGQFELTVTAYEQDQPIGSKKVQVFVDMLLGQSFDQLQSSLKPAVDENIPSSILGWTQTPPSGWNITNSSNMPQGTTEWQGWSFTTKDFWSKADGQNRGDFNLGQGVIAVADPDEWDDTGSPASTGLFDSTLTSPKIEVKGGQDLNLGFASHYKQEGAQTAEVTATFDNGEKQQVLIYNGNSASDNAGGHVLNKCEMKKIRVPDNAKTMQLNWRMYNAGNNWYWAVDDIRLDD